MHPWYVREKVMMVKGVYESDSNVELQGNEDRVWNQQVEIRTAPVSLRSDMMDECRWIVDPNLKGWV